MKGMEIPENTPPEEKSDNSRRDFIKQFSSLVAGGALTAMPGAKALAYTSAEEVKSLERWGYTYESAINTTFQEGDSHTQIKTLQRILNNHAFTISWDGAGSQDNETAYYGSKTKNAISLFQEAHELNADGVAGENTREHINVLAFPENKDLSWYEHKSNTEDLGYSGDLPEPQIRNLQMISRPTRHAVEGGAGKLLRALRYKSITSAVERRYNLPKGIILAMIMKESSGGATILNGSDDGGVGLSHMQPSVAREFGLKTYKDNNELRDTDHGKELRNLCEGHSWDLKELMKYDDRFHPVKNLDAVGRMLAAGIDGPRIAGLGPFRTALCRYAGRYNYKQYWDSLQHYMNVAQDSDAINKVRDEFNENNSELTINRKKGDFKKYLDSFTLDNYNYDLAKYERLPSHHTKNSTKILESLDQFIKR